MSGGVGLVRGAGPGARKIRVQSGQVRLEAQGVLFDTTNTTNSQLGAVICTRISGLHRPQGR